LFGSKASVMSIQTQRLTWTAALLVCPATMSVLAVVSERERAWFLGASAPPAPMVEWLFRAQVAVSLAAVVAVPWLTQTVGGRAASWVAIASVLLALSFARDGGFAPPRLLGQTLRLAD
jgi:hypothetical protein